jgi:Flp pilus assembly protein TadD
MVSHAPPGTPSQPARAAGPSLRPQLAWAPVLGLILGSSISGLAHTAGAEPGAMAWAVALPLLGLALSRQLSARFPRVLTVLLGIIGLFGLGLPTITSGLAGGLARALQLSPTQGLLLFLSCWLAASTMSLLPFSSAAHARPRQLALVALGAAVGFLVPGWLAMLAPAAAALVSLRDGGTPARATITAAPSPATTLAQITTVLLASWSLAHFWTAARGWLDPTPLAWWATILCASVSFALGWWLAGLRPKRLGLEPLIAGAGVLVGMVSLAELAPWVATELPGLLMQHSPRLVLLGLLVAPGALLCLLLGFASPPARPGVVPTWPLALASAAGLVLGVQGGPLGSTLIPLAAIMGGVMVLLVARRPIRRISGLVAAVALCTAWWRLPTVAITPLTAGWSTAIADEAGMGRHLASLARSEWHLATWGPEGSTALRQVGEVLVADVDGTPLWSEGRNPAAVRFAAHLPALLSRDPQRFLVIGDEMGWGMVTLLSYGPTTIQGAVAQPELLRAVVDTSEDLRRALLAPQVQLQPVPGAWLLRWSRPVDGILQIMLRPWPDSGASPPSRAGLELARARLAEGGIYVGVLAIDRVPEASLRSFLGDFAQVFPAGSACLPPTGADHLVLLGPVDDQPPPLARLTSRAATRRAALELLGLGDPLDIADRCVFPAAELNTWSRATSHRSPWPPMGLPPTLEQPPQLHLAELSSAMGSPDALWDLAGLEGASEQLTQRHEAVRHFLALLGETRTGDMEALFDRARALRASADGTRELDTLISPHLARAREHLDQARRGGVQHRGWQLAINELTLARMLHPAALDPLLLEAMVHEARGDKRKAERLYLQVLEAREDHLQAMFGLARIRISEGREAEAEATLRRALELHPREASAHQALGVALMRFGRLDDAEPVLRKAAALSSSDQPEPQAALAELFLAMERPSVAQAHAERAIRIAPSAYHYTLLGRCHFDLGRMAPAERYFHQAILVDPGFHFARAGLAHIYVLRGDYGQARDALQAVLTADPGNEAAQANLQEVMRMLDAEREDPRISISP